MSTYLYTARLSQKKKFQGKTVHLLKYVVSGCYGSRYEIAQTEAKKCQKRWEGKTLEYVMIGDDFKEGGFVYERTEPVWFDSYPLGKEVGYIPQKKIENDQTELIIKNYLSINQHLFGDLGKLYVLTETPFAGINVLYTSKQMYSTHNNSSMIGNFNLKDFTKIGSGLVPVLGLPKSCYQADIYEINQEMKEYYDNSRN